MRKEAEDSHLFLLCWLWAGLLSMEMSEGAQRREENLRLDSRPWFFALSQLSCLIRQIILTSKLCFLLCDTHITFLFGFFSSLPSLLIHLEKEIKLFLYF